MVKTVIHDHILASAHAVSVTILQSILAPYTVALAVRPSRRTAVKSASRRGLYRARDINRRTTNTSVVRPGCKSSSRVQVAMHPEAMSWPQKDRTACLRTSAPGCTTSSWQRQHQHQSNAIVLQLQIRFVVRFRPASVSCRSCSESPGLRIYRPIGTGPQNRTDQHQLS